MEPGILSDLILKYICLPRGAFLPVQGSELGQWSHTEGMCEVRALGTSLMKGVMGAQHLDVSWKDQFYLL